MPREHIYPPSFPDAAEERFLRLIVSRDADFPALWLAWTQSIVFDDIEYATLRLLPQLYLRLSALGIEDDRITGRIKGVYRLVWFKNQKLLEATRQVVLLCNQAGIPVVMLKGLAMLLDVYKNVGARATDDADLLIHVEDLPKAFDLLERAGWNCVSSPVGTVARDMSDLDAYTFHGHAVTFSRGDDASIDLHWQTFHSHSTEDPLRLLLLRGPRPLPSLTEHQWAHAQPAEVKGVPTQVLSPEDMLLHVVVHGAGWNAHRTLRWVVDAIAIINTGRFDWASFADLVRRSPYALEVQQACRYLHERMGVQPPASVLESLYALPVSAAARRAYRVKTREPSSFAMGSVPARWYRYWRVDAHGSTLQRVYGLPAYLRAQWKLEGRGSLRRFVWTKIRGRLERFRSTRR